MSKDGQTTKYTLRPSREDRIYIEFTVFKGKIESFVIQYHSKTPKGWRTIIRYDTAHRVAHKETYCYSKNKKISKILLGNNYNLVFTEAQKEIRDNWEKIKENYMFQ